MVARKWYLHGAIVNPSPLVIALRVAAGRLARRLAMRVRMVAKCILDPITELAFHLRCAMDLFIGSLT